MSTVTTERGFKLGKSDPVESPFGEFKTYFAEALPAPPPAAHWGGRVTIPWQMNGNGPDPTVTLPGVPANWPGAGDCVECFKTHALMTANFNEFGHTVPVPTANEAISQYCAFQNCTPEQLFTDANQYDNGEDMTNSLLGWTKGAEYGVTLPFTAPVNPKSQDDIKNAIYLGGGLGLGVQLPQSAEEAFPNEWVWVPSSPIMGGHAIWLTGYTDEYVALVSWGQCIKASWQFIMNTVDEAHALVLPQAVAATKGPTGLLIPKWESDLASL